MYDNINFEGFSERLKQALDGKNLTQVEAAQRLGISKHALTKYLNGRVPKAKILFIISTFFNKPMEWFLLGEKEAHDVVVAYERQPRTERGDLTIEQMCEILQKLMSSNDPNLRGWTVVQFKQAFGDYFANIDEDEGAFADYTVSKKDT